MEAAGTRGLVKVAGKPQVWSGLWLHHDVTRVVQRAVLNDLQAEKVVFFSAEKFCLGLAVEASEQSERRGRATSVGVRRLFR